MRVQKGTLQLYILKLLHLQLEFLSFVKRAPTELSSCDTEFMSSSPDGSRSLSHVESSCFEGRQATEHPTTLALHGLEIAALSSGRILILFFLSFALVLVYCSPSRVYHLFCLLEQQVDSFRVSDTYIISVVVLLQLG